MTPSMTTETENATTVRVQLGEVLDTTYHCYETFAPQEYDGFGTFTIDECETQDSRTPMRFVLIDSRHLEWQLGRYRSGFYTPIPVNHIRESALAEIIYKRLLGKEHND